MRGRKRTSQKKAPTEDAEERSSCSIKMQQTEPTLGREKGKTGKKEGMKPKSILEREKKKRVREPPSREKRIKRKSANNSGSGEFLNERSCSQEKTKENKKGSSKGENPRN